MSMSRRSVLVVDDESGIRQVLTRVLPTLGYEVCVADSVRAGLSILAERPMDVVLCDLRMPELNGLELQKALRGGASRDGQPEGRNAAPAFVLMSGYATVAEVALVFRGGAADFLQKPFGRDELQETLDRALKGRELVTAVVDV